jgi:starch phosphorylase
MTSHVRDGSEDRRRAEDHLAQRLPEPIRPLASLAHNYWWSWQPGVEGIFGSIDPEGWSRSGENPVRFLQEVDPPVIADLPRRNGFVRDLQRSAGELTAYLAARATSGPPPVAYMCAEFGIHRSLPFYAGGLGVLAGDFLKQASDLGMPFVGVGLFYREGSFHQRLDVSGWQHEYWRPTDSDRLPAVLVSDDHGPLRVSVRIRGRDVHAQIWRVDVGASRLYLLDTDVPPNTDADRWITARLYVGDRELRLAQYAILGIGGLRALRAMGIHPRRIHLNEGHSALATLENLREHLQEGDDFDRALAAVRSRFVFTTHTPVWAGNESFGPETLDAVLPGFAESLGVADDALWRLAGGGDGRQFGLTPLALRLSGPANAVSELHGRVARAMWAHVRDADAEAAIGHVTNGVHLPTWLAPEWQQLLDRYVPGWREAPPGSAIWQAIDAIPERKVWSVRCTLRRQLAAVVRHRSVRERLGRGETVAYAESAARTWGDDALTIGFARRIATYKRLYLLTSRPDRAIGILTGHPPVQIVIAGRAHPQDDEAKATVQHLFRLNDAPGVGGRAVFLEEYDLGLSRHLVQGCDLWLNLPRLPLEACGTSGMKSAVNGGIQLSVLDGWWAEAHEAGVGWGIVSDPALSPEEQDRSDGDRCFDMLEREVIPLFHERDTDGVPRRWVAMIRASMRKILPGFSAARMAREYQERVYGKVAT